MSLIYSEDFIDSLQYWSLIYSEDVIDSLQYMSLIYSEDFIDSLQYWSLIYSEDVIDSLQYWSLTYSEDFIDSLQYMSLIFSQFISIDSGRILYLKRGHSPHQGSQQIFCLIVSLDITKVLPLPRELIDQQLRLRLLHQCRR